MPGFDRLSANFGHDVALTTQVLIAQSQKVVDDKSCKKKKYQIKTRLKGLKSNM